MSSLLSNNNGGNQNAQNNLIKHESLSMNDPYTNDFSFWINL